MTFRKNADIICRDLDNDSVPELLIGIFTDTKEIIILASKGIRIISFSLLFASVPMITGAFYQSAGKKGRAFVMFSATLIFAIPLILILPKFWEIEGIWLSYTLASLFAAVLGIGFFKKLEHN